jgi:hypothetical protein
LKFYDWGKVEIFSQGAQAASVAGELWVTYDIELFKPRLPTSSSNALGTDLFILSSVGTNTPVGSVTASPVTGSSVGTYLDGANDRVIFPTLVTPGYYLVEFAYEGDSTASSQPPTPTGDGTYCVGVDYYENFGSTLFRSPNTGVTVASVACGTCIYYNGGAAGYIAVAPASVMPANALGTVTVSRIDPDIITMALRSKKREKDRAFGYDPLVDSQLFKDFLRFRKFLNHVDEDDNLSEDNQDQENSYELAPLIPKGQVRSETSNSSKRRGLTAK